MKGATLLWGYFCVTVSFWILARASVTSSFTAFEFDPSNILGWFAISQFDVGTAIALTVGGIAGLLGYLFKVGVTANGVILIWILALIFKPTNQILLGLPNFLDAWLKPYGLGWLSIVPQAFFAFSIFLWFAEIMAQQRIAS